MERKKRILIIDDEPDIRDTIKDALSYNGFDAIAASGAEQALEILNRDATVKPGVILLDLMMPDRDGGEFLIDWRKSPGFEDIPIILISADCHVEAKTTGFRVEGFLKKPIDLGRLLQVVGNYCDQDVVN